MIGATSVDKTIILTKDECMNTYYSKNLVFDGKIFKIKRNDINRFNFFLNGSVIVVEDILLGQLIHCSAKGIHYDNRYFKDGYFSAEIKFETHKIGLLRTLNGYETVDSQQFLGNCDEY